MRQWLTNVCRHQRLCAVFALSWLTGACGADVTFWGTNDGPASSAGTSSTGAVSSGGEGGPCVIDVDVSYSHACAIRDDRSVWCWGDGSVGQLGDGAGSKSTVPVRVSALVAPVSNVTTGNDYSCALSVDHELYCWGYNEMGQAGANAPKFQAYPFKLPPFGTASSRVVQVEAGCWHTCARKDDGTVWCWGWNAAAQLGDGTQNSRNTPAQVEGLGNSVTKVALGCAHSCALKQDGSVWCWGHGFYGETGTGKGAAKSVIVALPTQVQALANGVAGVYAGAKHTCALKKDGTLWCWGDDSIGELGDGGSHAIHYLPVRATAFGEGVVDVFLGTDYTCVKKTDQGAWCLGFNANGELGDGTTFARNAPVLINPPGGVVTEIAASLADWIDVGFLGGVTCARTAVGTLSCWGFNNHGQLGNGSVGTSVASPSAVNMTCP